MISLPAFQFFSFSFPCPALRDLTSVFRPPPHRVHREQARSYLIRPPVGAVLARDPPAPQPLSAFQFFSFSVFPIPPCLSVDAPHLFASLKRGYPPHRTPRGHRPRPQRIRRLSIFDTRAARLRAPPPLFVAFVSLCKNSVPPRALCVFALKFRPTAPSPAPPCVTRLTAQRAVFLSALFPLLPSVKKPCPPAVSSQPFSFSVFPFARLALPLFRL